MNGRRHRAAGIAIAGVAALVALAGCSVVAEDTGPADVTGTASSARTPAPPPPPRSYPNNCSQIHGDLPYYGEILGADFGYDAEPILRVPPNYPIGARNDHVEGDVGMAALVCEHGKVLEIRVEQSIPGLDEEAMNALSQWTFRPAERGGKPIASWVHRRVKFALH